MMVVLRCTWCPEQTYERDESGRRRAVCSLTGRRIERPDCAASKSDLRQAVPSMLFVMLRDWLALIANDEILVAVHEIQAYTQHLRNLVDEMEERLKGGDA